MQNGAGMDDQDAPTAGESRRGVLKGFAALMTASLVQAGCAPKPSGDAFFAERDTKFLHALADTLIPEVDSPGAISAGVPATFDSMMKSWASVETGEEMRRTLRALARDLERRGGEVFVDASAAKRLPALEALDADAFGARRDDYEGWREIKKLLVRIYYFSEAGATRELRYDETPGGWWPDLPLAEVGRTWAT